MLKPSILVVDDEPLNLKLVSQSLGNEYLLHFAVNARDGLEFLQTNMVDLVLLDIIMPEMDGFAMTTEIRALPMNHQVAIIYLTGDHSDTTIERAFELGDDYISKPFRPKELAARVRNAIKRELLSKKQAKLIAYNQHLMQVLSHYVDTAENSDNVDLTATTPSNNSSVID